MNETWPFISLTAVADACMDWCFINHLQACISLRSPLAVAGLEMINEAPTTYNDHVSNCGKTNERPPLLTLPHSVDSFARIAAISGVDGEDDVSSNNVTDR
jgi:hypothetical protein